MSAEQMAAMLAMFPLVAKATERMQKDADKLSGTPLDTTTTFESVLSKDQLTQAQASSSQSSGGGGLGGMLARKIMKTGTAEGALDDRHDAPRGARGRDRASRAADLAIPADFKEKK